MVRNAFPMNIITILIYVKTNENSIGAFPYSNPPVHTVLDEHELQDFPGIVGPKVKGVNICIKNAPGKRMNIVNVFLKPIAIQFNNTA